MAKDKNMNQDAANDEEMTVTLTLDDGTELECVVLTIFEAADKEYIALLPLDGNEAEDGEVYLYRYTEINGTPDICIPSPAPRQALLCFPISRATRSTRSLLMRSMNFSTPKSTTRL